MQLYFPYHIVVDQDGLAAAIHRVVVDVPHHYGQGAGPTHGGGPGVLDYYRDMILFAHLPVQDPGRPNNSRAVPTSASCNNMNKTWSDTKHYNVYIGFIIFQTSQGKIKL